MAPDRLPRQNALNRQRFIMGGDDDGHSHVNSAPITTTEKMVA